MIQAPNYVNPYLQQPQVNPYLQQPPMQPYAQQMQMPAPNYNAVKIDVHNPSVTAPGMGQAGMPAPQYAQPTAPIYNYPQAQLYDYPQAPVQPYYMPQQPMATVPCPTCLPQQPAPEVAQAVAQPVVQQQNINAPAPVVTQPAPAEAQTTVAPKVDVVPPQPMAPQVDLNSFIAKLTNPDYEIQANAMEEIANMVKEEPQKATELLDEKVVDALNKIINTDSSKLEGPTQEQVTARQKLSKGEQVTDAEKQLATKITPMEQAERNKSYAMFTSAIMQKLYGEEVLKLTGSTVPLTELPGTVAIVEQLKNNPNPMVRTSAIEALSYIQQPAYKKDLTTLFTIAQNDQDKNVQDAAKVALEKLAQVSDEAPAQQAQAQAQAQAKAPAQAEQAPAPAPAPAPAEQEPAPVKAAA